MTEETPRILGELNANQEKTNAKEQSNTNKEPIYPSLAPSAPEYLKRLSMVQVPPGETHVRGDELVDLASESSDSDDSDIEELEELSFFPGVEIK